MTAAAAVIERYLNQQPQLVPLSDQLGVAEHNLWCAALAQMQVDAKSYWHGKGVNSATPGQLEEAFDALCDCTWMLKRICAYTGHSPEWISAGFIKWCEQN